MSSPQPEVEFIGPDGVPIGVIRPSLPPPQRIWLHVALLALVFVYSTVLAGLEALPASFPPIRWWEPTLRPDLVLRLLFVGPVVALGSMFSVPLIIIFLVHEAGHYIACRLHRLDATLPYFIPLPIGIGTLGAFIRIRTPIRSKRELLDVGAAGPIAGFLATLPFLWYGVAHSRSVAEMPSGAYALLGEPPIYRVVAATLFPTIADGDLWVHPTGYAAIIGLFLTAVNLLPFGQLDGGHVTYALFGRLHRRAAPLLLIVLFVLGFRYVGWWIWTAIALLMGVVHPRVPDEVVPLDPRRRIVAWICLVVFALCFTPEPIKFVP